MNCEGCGFPMVVCECTVESLRQQLAASEAARVEAVRERHDAVDLSRRVVRGQFAQICSYCGKFESPPPHGWEELQKHVQECLEHPVYKLKRERDALASTARTFIENSGVVREHPTTLDDDFANIAQVVLSQWDNAKREQAALAAALAFYGNHKKPSCPLAGPWAEISSAVWKGNSPTCNCGFDDALRGSQAILRAHDAALVKPLVTVKEAVESWADCRQTAEGALNLIHSVVDKILADWRKQHAE